MITILIIVTISVFLYLLFLFAGVISAKIVVEINEKVEYAISLGANEALRYRVSYYVFHRKRLNRIIKHLESKKNG